MFVGSFLAVFNGSQKVYLGFPTSWFIMMGSPLTCHAFWSPSQGVAQGPGMSTTVMLDVGRGPGANSAVSSPGEVSG